MKKRYKHQKNGSFKTVARIYSKEEHNIDCSKIDKQACAIVTRLVDSGFESYIVGGALRDLMLGNTPKDFDIVTQASPRQVHKIFRNSRIIGKRFKIVHVVSNNKIYEVSTFRSLKDDDSYLDNIFGTVEEDAKRRDFSVNSLYYNPIDCTVLDFNGAIEDFRRKRVRSLIPLNKTFVEDPVRMIRAVKCSVMCGFSIGLKLKFTIRNFAHNLEQVSSSRLTEELNKILASGKSSIIINELAKYGLLPYILPSVAAMGKSALDSISLSLEELDSVVCKAKNCNDELPGKNVMYLALTRKLIVVDNQITDLNLIRADVTRQIKYLLLPSTPPNFEIDKACTTLMRENGLKVKSSFSKKKKAILFPKVQ